MKQPSDPSVPAVKQLITCTNAVVIIIGNVIGSGIFISPRGVFINAGSTGMSLTIWTITGLLSAIGAVCYAELGRLIQRSGEDYIYIYRLWGKLPGVTCFWTTISIGNPLFQVISAITFSSYMLQPFYKESPPPKGAVQLIAASAISNGTEFSLSFSLNWWLSSINRFSQRHQLCQCAMGLEDPEYFHSGQSYISVLYHGTGLLVHYQW